MFENQENDSRRVGEGGGAVKRHKVKRFLLWKSYSVGGRFILYTIAFFVFLTDYSALFQNYIQMWTFSFSLHELVAFIHGSSLVGKHPFIVLVCKLVVVDTLSFIEHHPLIVTTNTGNSDIKDRSQSVNMNFDQNVGGISTEKSGIRAVLSYADLLLQTTSGNCSSILYKAKWFISETNLDQNA